VESRALESRLIEQERRHPTIKTGPQMPCGRKFGPLERSMELQAAASRGVPKKTDIELKERRRQSAKETRRLPDVSWR